MWHIYCNIFIKLKIWREVTKKIIGLITFFVFFNITVFSASAGRNISLPFEEDFDSSDYTSDIVWLSNGAKHNWESGGGWSSGSAKFTPGTIYQPYCGVGEFTNINSPRLNVRFLYYVGSTYTTYASSDATNKWLIFNRSTGQDGHRAIVMQHGFAPNSWDFGLCNNIECEYENPRFNFNDWAEQWVCFEFEADINAGTIKAYITTQDGTYNETLFSSIALSGRGVGNWERINGIGFFYSGAGTPHVDNYWKIDELRIDNDYIGPPLGFFDGSGSAPAIPKGVTGE